MTDNICWIIPPGIFIRTFHTLLTLGIFTALCVTETDLHQAYKDGLWAYLACYVALLIFTSILYFVSSLIDPGYLPKKQYEVRKRTISFSSSSSESSDEDGDDDERNKGENSTMLKKKKRSQSPGVKLRKCPVCKIEQPVRTKHCEDCQRCVRKYDHHCPWLENCVGERNHRFFWIFLLLQSVLILWTLKITWNAFTWQKNFTDWLHSNGIFTLVFLVLVVAAMVVISLLCCHSFMLCNNQTTWEFMSRHRITYLRNLDESLNPFHEGYFKNCIKFFFYCPYRRWEVMIEKYCTPHGGVV